MNNKNNKPPTEVKIEPNVPIPDGRIRTGKWKTLLSKFAPGESIFVTLDEARMVYQAARMLGVKTTRRKIEDGVRIWRIE